jgi:glycine hydroxymethyltransferase
MDNEKLLNNYVLLEQNRQNDGLELIASENFTSKEVRALTGSILTNKYAEGFPGFRYYGGCIHVDQIEQLAIDLACQLFGCKFANVQPHSGSSANMIAYASVLKYGDKILSLGLDEGGHLTHGSPVSFSGKYYQVSHYHLKSDGHIDYQNLKETALKERPNLILAGFSSYPYEIDFKFISEVAKEVGAVFMVDIAHISGLVATGYHPSPFPYADIVTTTTHKTIRGPRGGMILTNSEEINKKMKSMTFPGMQGGPLEHVIAAKAQCFIEALRPEFKEYIRRVLENTKACAEEMKRLGAEVSGTDTHLFLVNTKKSFGLTGADCSHKLEEIGITLNKNMIPNDVEKPSVTSGVRIGFAALTTRGITKQGAKKVGQIIFKFLSGKMTIEEGLIKTKEIVSTIRAISEI